MDELHARSADVARSFLASQLEVIDEHSRLFEDVQRLALDTLVTLRTEESRGDRKVGELRAWWPGMPSAA